MRLNIICLESSNVLFGVPAPSLVAPSASNFPICRGFSVQFAQRAIVEDDSFCCLPTQGSDPIKHDEPGMKRTFISPNDLDAPQCKKNRN